MSNLSFSQQLALTIYQSQEIFPVDLDDAWVWLGYSTKQKAEKKLKSNFEEGIDFLAKGLKTSTGGRPSQLVMLSVDCFKSLGMMAGTEQGKVVRKYFLECERIAKASNIPQPAMTQIQILAALAQQMAEQEQRLLEQERRQNEVLARLKAVEVEQDRFNSPCGHKYSVMGFAKLRGLEISLSQAGSKGKKASALCRKQGVEVEQIHDPRFGYVGLYPESILDQVFSSNSKDKAIARH
ncbi:hypothetical protein [Nostoc sp. UHCC 0251]|uniref:hypothetical protein n=1 Tax=Nostoc sp. UHCC 0251 TaxID=3110240 RepID=UPI002B21D082|nr:hypothetical protein [Nostoc sp. UHCC 0251]MEA5628106.1 hypothetical protein [Nostoc sp. UHCC 0251]